jgi:hypothetical protein
LRIGEAIGLVISTTSTIRMMFSFHRPLFGGAGHADNDSSKPAPDGW